MRNRPGQADRKYESPEQHGVRPLLTPGVGQVAACPTRTGRAGHLPASSSSLAMSARLRYPPTFWARSLISGKIFSNRFPSVLLLRGESSGAVGVGPASGASASTKSVAF